MKLMKDVLSILDSNHINYFHHSSVRYITLTLPNGVVLDFSLGGVFNNHYYDSRVKRAHYMNSVSEIKNLEIKNGNLIIKEMGLNLPLFEAKPKAETTTKRRKIDIVF